MRGEKVAALPLKFRQTAGGDYHASVTRAMLGA